MDELEYERRLSRVEDRSKSNTYRLGEMEKRQENLSELVRSVAAIAQKQTDMDADMQEIKADVKRITDRPVRRWEAVAEKATLTLVAALVGWLLVRLGVA